MTPTDLRQNFLPVKSVGLHYTHFRNHLPLFMRLPGPKNPKNCQILRRVAKVGLGGRSVRVLVPPGADQMWSRQLCGGATAARESTQQTPEDRSVGCAGAAE